MELGELIRRYREGGAFQRNELISKTLAGFKFKLLRRLVKRAYFKAGCLDQVVFHGHRDAAYFKKLLGWAIVERSGTLDNDHVAILAKHRTSHLAKGPNTNADPDTSILDLDINEEKEEGSDMETKKKHSTATAKASKKKTTEPKDGTIRCGGLQFAEDETLVLKAGAETNKNFPKKGKVLLVAQYFKKPMSFKLALAKVDKELESGELKKLSRKNYTKDFARNQLTFVLGKLGAAGLIAKGASNHQTKAKTAKKAVEAKTEAPKEAETTKTA